MRLSISAAVILAALLVSTRLVHSQRQFEFFDNSLISNLDETDLGPEKALSLIDKLCSQEKDAENMVSGAVNILSGDFLNWTDYRKGPGQYYDINHYYAAHTPWETFKGTCFFHQYATWYKDGVTSEGTHRENTEPKYQTRHLPINVEIPGFTAETSIPSQMGPVQDRLTALNIFRNLRGLPEKILMLWIGFTIWTEPQMRYHNLAKTVPGCSDNWLTATTVERFVRVRWVFKVDHFNFDYSTGGDSVDSWEGRGSGWKYVTSSSAWIDGHGIAKQTPDDLSYIHLQALHTALPAEEECRP
jgi:hypothetical protein